MTVAALPSSDFWRGRRVFVTGHTGFKGSWLTLWLTQMGAEVTGYALEPSTEPSLYRLMEVDELLHRSVVGDVCDLSGLLAAFDDARPEVVFHLAAQALVRESYRDPVRTYATNVMGTVHVMEAIRQSQTVRAGVIVTSDKCYENDGTVTAYREADRMGGFDPYSSSKGSAELAVAAYRRSYFENRDGSGVPGIASGRAGNVLGGGDWAKDRLVPDLIRGYAAGRPVLIRHPDAVRPWQHVLEPLNGYLLLAERLWEDRSVYASAWNFGPQLTEARPVGWIADRVAELWGGSATWVRDPGAQPHEAHALRLEWSKAYVHLGWRPIWSIDETLQRTVGWYRTWREVDHPHELRATTVSQIADYVEAGLSAETPAQPVDGRGTAHGTGV